MIESHLQTRTLTDALDRVDALLDEDGFFAREAQVVQTEYFCMGSGTHRVTIDFPLLAFFADDGGVHAATRFDRDCFTKL